MSEFDLLREYFERRSQPAFTQLVERYVNLVYAAARRQTGDAALAEDITQAVFLLLAQKAASIATDRPLSGWLLSSTRYCVANARRSRQKRELHERRAAEMMARELQANADGSSRLDELGPLLDEGLARLRARDRDAVLLKFFESKTHSEVGGALGISEAAAIKRVNRAVDRLRDYFQRRGVALSASALSTALVAESSKAAPAALLQAITNSAAALAAAPAIFSIAKGAMILVATEKAKFAAIAVVVLLLGTGGGIVAFRTISSHTTPSEIKLVADSAPPPTHLAAGPTFPIQLSDGCIIETLGISDPNARPVQWWAANGAIESAPSVPGFGTLGVGLLPGQEKRELFFRMSGPVSDHTLRIELTPFLACAVGEMLNKDLLLDCISAVPGNQQTTTIHFFVSHGPWQTDETRAAGDTNPPAPSAHIQSIVAQGNQIVATLNPHFYDDYRKRDKRVFVRLKNRKEVNFSSQSNGPQAWRFTFACAMDQVAEVVISSRPIEQVEMRNVALKPATRPTSIEVIRQTIVK